MSDAKVEDKGGNMDHVSNGSRLQRAPVFFIGHGSPMNALENKSYTERLGQMREIYPNPKAILCVSAHWLTTGTWVTGMAKPKTIHDFYGFPQELFDVQYPAPGSPELAQAVVSAISEPKIQVDVSEWGLDHGTWSVLRHMFPDAKTPVVQLSVAIAMPPDYHYKLGQQLKQLREQGVLIIASGNIVHNLRKISWEADAKAHDWAIEFDERVKSLLIERNASGLLSEFQTTPAGKLSVPTPDHYYPLLYIVGAADEQDKLHFDYEGMQNAAISMRSFSYRS
jgi:4,5-DOPA dioxygenase extradiol